MLYAWTPRLADRSTEHFAHFQEVTQMTRVDRLPRVIEHLRGGRTQVVTEDAAQCRIGNYERESPERGLPIVTMATRSPLPL
jgi:hypothetical protein